MDRENEDQCAYTHDLTDSDYLSDLDGDEWRCPHWSHGDHDLCLFHLAPSDRDVDPETVVTRLRNLVTGEADALRPTERLRFIGATFRGLDFEHVVLDGPDTRPVDLRDAKFAGPVVFSHADIEHPIRGSGATFEAAVQFVDCESRFGLTFNEATFEQLLVLDDAALGSLDCRGADFQQLCRCRRITVSGEVNFQGSHLEGVTFEEATIEGDLYFSEGTYRRRARFDGADVGGVVSLSRATFRNGLWAVEVTIGDGLIANDTQFGGAVHFHEATVSEGSRIHATRFESVADFRSATFDSLSITPATFDSEVRFDGARFAELNLDSVAALAGISLAECAVTDTASLADVTFPEMLDCRGADFQTLVIEDPGHDADHGMIDLGGSTIKSGRFGQSLGGVVYDLERATLGSVVLEEGPTSPPLRWYRFLRTDFEGFDFSSHKLAFAESGWQLHSSDDPHGVWTGTTPSAVDLEVTYLKAKTGASNTGDSEAASHFYRKEMAYRRRKYLSQVRGDPRLERRLKAGILTLFNLFMGATTGHGERARRVVSSSMIVIAGFAIVYWQALQPPVATGDGALDYLALSAQIFLTFVLGTDVETSSLLLTGTAAVEGFIGAFFIALFVFALTRSIKR